MQLENTLREGRLDKGWGSIQFPPLMEVIETEMEPCQYIYAAYEYNSETGTTRDDLASIFQKYGEGDSIFRGVDRIKLILTIISARSFEGGCQLDVHKLIQQNCMLGYSPIHDYVELRGLEDEWLRFLQAPWKQKCDAVKDYFGEKIGMYFLFLGHYTTWLIPAGVMGFIAYIDVSADNDNPSAPIIPYFAVFMSIWSTLMLEFWCRKEKLHAMKWGMVGFEDEEQARPQFHGTLIPGPVTGELFLYFPTNEYMKRVFTSTAIVSGCILVVLGVIISIFILKIVLTSMKSLTVGGTQMGGIIVSLVNAVQIQVLNMLYGTVAIALNNFENHRTNTEYEDALIAKTFIFQFVNSFSPMFYIAFVKPFIPEYDACLVSCMSELQTSLGTIFMTRLATGSVVEILVPYLNNKNREKANLEGTDFKVSDMSNVERGYMQEEYHVMLGPFADFANMTIQFGYTTMFVVAFPLATIIAFISNYIEIRIGAWKLCQLCRRPEPRSCEDIGTWYSIFQTISFSAALVNAGIIAFTSEIANKYTWVVRVWLFFSISLLLLGAKTVVQMLTPDMPLDVDIQLQRQKYIVDKVINNIPDDNDDALGKNVSIEQDYPIRITDDDPL